MRNTYIALAVAGTLLPWIFFAGFIGEHGLDLPGFIGALFSNGASAGFAADILISSAAFFLWSFLDSRKRGIAHWWVVVPSVFLVGLSLGLPLYLAMREGRT
ncbi:MAG: DUF2834 domain-containing protein [Phyllobacteriaceae bacterium]|nr:DUF2834 domain-containing protein [Phyllobacteriaceae bacterium]